MKKKYSLLLLFFFFTSFVLIYGNNEKTVILKSAENDVVIANDVKTFHLTITGLSSSEELKKLQEKLKTNKVFDIEFGQPKTDGEIPLSLSVVSNYSNAKLAEVFFEFGFSFAEIDGERKSLDELIKQQREKEARRAN
jgi:ABC-type molybdate transport system substrate-binding protein